MSDSFDPKGGKGFRLGGFAGAIFPTIILGGLFLGAGILWTNREQFCRQFPDAPLICKPGTPFVPLVPPGPRDPGDPDPRDPEIQPAPGIPAWCGVVCDNTLGLRCPEGMICGSGGCEGAVCDSLEGNCGAACDPSRPVEYTGCLPGLECLDGICGSTVGVCDRDVPSTEERIGRTPTWCGAVCDETLGMNCPAGMECMSGFCTAQVCSSYTIGGACGGICTSHLPCAAPLTCENGRCVNEDVCALVIHEVEIDPPVDLGVPPLVISPVVSPAVSPEPASLTVCSSRDQNGIRWEGLTCTCQGAEVYTYICNNNQPIHQPTGNSCTPPADCPADGGGSGDPSNPPSGPTPCCIFFETDWYCGDQYCPNN